MLSRIEGRLPACSCMHGAALGRQETYVATQRFHRRSRSCTFKKFCWCMGRLLHHLMAKWSGLGAALQLRVNGMKWWRTKTYSDVCVQAICVKFETSSPRNTVHIHQFLRDHDSP